MMRLFFLTLVLTTKLNGDFLATAVTERGDKFGMGTHEVLGLPDGILLMTEVD